MRNKILILLFGILFLGSLAYAQPGVTIGADKAPLEGATLDVIGKLRVESVDEGGVDILTWDRTSPTGTFLVKRIAMPDTAKNNSILVWNQTLNKWEIKKGGIYTGNFPITIDENNVIGISDTTRDGKTPENGDVIVWRDGKWVIEKGIPGDTGNYRGIDPIVVAGDSISIKPGTQDGDLLVWNETLKIWEVRQGPANAKNWLIGGNDRTSVLDPDKDFIGTLADVDFAMRTNNVERARITSAGLFVVNEVIAADNFRFQVYSGPNDDAAMLAVAPRSSGESIGVYGETWSSGNGAAGLKGVAVNSSGAAYGVMGTTSSSGNQSAGVLGFSDKETTTGPTFGVVGDVLGGAWGSAGVQGVVSKGRNTGVSGVSGSPDPLSQGVFGITTGPGVAGGFYYGVHGDAWLKNCDVMGIGVFGEGSKYGLLGIAKCKDGYAIYGNGDLAVSGGKQFHIDHPLDPANKYLNHVCPESPEALNMYTGNVTTNANGEGVVTLPSYFQALNKDFRYTLTVVGQPAVAYVGQKIEGNRFVVKTDKPNVEVSWMVTALRNDPYMQQNPMAVETEKEAFNKGKYLHPELYGQPEEKGIFFNPDRAATHKMYSNMKHLAPTTPVGKPTGSGGNK